MGWTEKHKNYGVFPFTGGGHNPNGKAYNWDFPSAIYGGALGCESWVFTVIFDDNMTHYYHQLCLTEALW